MSLQAKARQGHPLHSRDGEIGNARGNCFEDRQWAIPGMLAATGHWREDQQVLISPRALGARNVLPQ